MAAKYNGIHKRQLFHWIRSSIDERTHKLRGTLCDEARMQYVDYLRGSLENGLWLKVPNAPETIQVGSERETLRIAMTCFTEWSVGESALHTRRYGRLGLGFSRKWVLDRGGQPVTYFKQSSRGHFAKCVIKLLRDGERLSPELQHVLSYVKPHKPAPQAGAATGGSTTPRPTTRSKPDPFKGIVGAPLPFVEEREWRIVETGVPEKHRKPAQTPVRFFLPYKPGSGLLTVVLPDNKTMAWALQDRAIRAKLFAPGRPAVTVLSLENTGSF